MGSLRDTDCSRKSTPTSKSLASESDARKTPAVDILGFINDNREKLLKSATVSPDSDSRTTGGGGNIISNISTDPRQQGEFSASPAQSLSFGETCSQFDLRNLPAGAPDPNRFVRSPFLCSARHLEPLCIEIPPLTPEDTNLDVPSIWSTLTPLTPTCLKRHCPNTLVPPTSTIMMTCLECVEKSPLESSRKEKENMSSPSAAPTRLHRPVPVYPAQMSLAPGEIPHGGSPTNLEPLKTMNRVMNQSPEHQNGGIDPPHLDFKSLMVQTYEVSDPVISFRPIGVEEDPDEANPGLHNYIQKMLPHAVKRKHETEKELPTFIQETNKSATKVYNAFDDSKITKLEKRLKSAKGKLRILEENFAGKLGYRPNYYDKLMSEDMRKCVHEIARIKSELKVLRAAELKPPLTASRLYFPAVPSGSTLEQTFQSGMQFVLDRRREAGRPDRLDEMTFQELRAEKGLVQRVLLFIETAHGRPSSPVARDLVRPLYDWYSQIKKVLADQASPRTSLSELKTIIEGKQLVDHSGDELPGAGPDPDSEQADDDSAGYGVGLSSSCGLYPNRYDGLLMIDRSAALARQPFTNSLPGTPRRSLPSITPVPLSDLPFLSTATSAKNGQTETKGDLGFGSSETILPAITNPPDSADNLGGDSGVIMDDKIYAPEPNLRDNAESAAQLHRLTPDDLHRVYRDLLDRKRKLKKMMAKVDHQQETSAKPPSGRSRDVAVVDERTYSGGSSNYDGWKAEYKQLRGKIRLVEALLTKYRASC